MRSARAKCVTVLNDNKREMRSREECCGCVRKYGYCEAHDGCGNIVIVFVDMLGHKIELFWVYVDSINYDTFKTNFGVIMFVAVLTNPYFLTVIS